MSRILFLIHFHNICSTSFEILSSIIHHSIGDQLLLISVKFICKMSLFRSVNLLIKICQFTGLAPISMYRTTLKWESNTALKVLSIIFMFCIGCLFLSGIIFSDTFYDFKRPKVHISLRIILVVLNQMHSFVMIFELSKKRNKQIGLLNMFGN